MHAVPAPAPKQALRIEIRRKIFHFLSLVYAMGYFFLGRERVLAILAPILVVEGALEFSRLFLPRLNQRLLALFGGIHREEETRRVSGIFWTLLGSVLTFWLIPDRAATLCAMGYLIFGDTAAAFVGVAFGRHRFGNKSVEGSAAFFAVSFAVGLAFFPPSIALIGALFAALVEMLPLPFNDNLWIPVVSGLFLLVLI